MHHDKLKKCEATEIPRWLRNYQKQVIDGEPSSESKHYPNVPVPKSVKPLKSVLKKTEHTAVPQTTSSQSVGGGPYLGTRNRARDHQAVASESVKV